MLRHLRQLFTNNLPLQFTLGYGTLLAAGLFAVTLACVWRSEQAIEQAQQQFGTTTAAQLAQLSVSAVAERNLVGLQAILARAAVEPIISAAIYDVENHLLAQAGQPPSHRQSNELSRHFNAPIGLGDNITGNVSVVLDISADRNAIASMRLWLWLTAALLLAGIGALSWHFGSSLREQRRAASRALLELAPSSLTERYLSDHTGFTEQQLRQLLLDVRHYVDTVSSPTPAQLQEAAQQIIDCRDGRLYLLLACKNLELLKKQVSREPLAHLLTQAEQRIFSFAQGHELISLPVAGSYFKFVLPVVSREQLPTAVSAARQLAEQLLAELATVSTEGVGIRLNWAGVLDWHPPATSELARNQQLAADHQRSEWLCLEAGRYELVLSVEAGSWLKDSDLELVHSESGLPFYRKPSAIEPAATSETDSNTSETIETAEAVDETSADAADTQTSTSTATANNNTADNNDSAHINEAEAKTTA